MAILALILLAVEDKEKMVVNVQIAKEAAIPVEKEAAV